LNPFYEFYVRAQWRNRRETAAEAGERLGRLLRELPLVHPALGRWFVERSKRLGWFDPLGSMPPQPAELEAALLRGAPSYPPLPKRSPERGFYIQAWNGKGLGRPNAEFRTQIGAYDAQGPAINRFEFLMHDNVAARDPLFLPEVVKELVRLLVDTMEPDCIDVAPIEWLDSMDEQGCPAGGWMSYVRDISLCDFPIGLHQEAIGEEGILASVTKKVFWEKDAYCRGLAEDLNESLSEVRKWMVRPIETGLFSKRVRIHSDATEPDDLPFIRSETPRVAPSGFEQTDRDDATFIRGRSPK
jgi:hypothetical protein